MKKIIFTALLIIIISTTGAITSHYSFASLGAPSGASTPDILIQSKVDQVWSSYLIERLRTLFANTEVTDPFNMQFDDKTVTSAILPADLAPDQKALFTELAQSMGLDIEHSTIQVVTKGLAYSVAKASPDIRPVILNGHVNGLQSDLDLTFSDVQVTAKEIDLSLMVAPKDGSAPFEFLKVSLLKPFVHVDPTALLGFSCRLEPTVGDEKMSFKVLQSSFVDISEFLLKNDSKVAFEAGEVVMDPITIHIGPKTDVITAAKVAKIVDQNEVVIKKVLMSQFADSLTAGLGETFLKLIFDQPYATDVWLPSHVYSKIKVDAIRDANSDQMSIDLSGSFCSRDDYIKYADHCGNYEKFWPDVRPT